jgi:hypothetical protein
MDFGVIAMPTLKIQIKAVYGTLKAYPMCDQSKLFAKIVGTTTLTSAALKKIQALGYSFECKTYDIQEVMQ